MGLQTVNKKTGVCNMRKGCVPIISKVRGFFKGGRAKKDVYCGHGKRGKIIPAG